MVKFKSGSNRKISAAASLLQPAGSKRSEAELMQ
jgi:hypothetical protein